MARGRHADRRHRRRDDDHTRPRAGVQRRRCEPDHEGRPVTGSAHAEGDRPVRVEGPELTADGAVTRPVHHPDPVAGVAAERGRRHHGRRSGRGGGRRHGRDHLHQPASAVDVVIGVPAEPGRLRQRWGDRGRGARRVGRRPCHRLPALRTADLEDDRVVGQRGAVGGGQRARQAHGLADAGPMGDAGGGHAAGCAGRGRRRRGRRGVGGRGGRRPGAGRRGSGARLRGGRSRSGSVWTPAVRSRRRTGRTWGSSPAPPGTGRDRAGSGRRPTRPAPGAGAGAPITLWAICCTGSGRCPVYAAAMPLLRATVTTTAVPPAPSRPIVRRGSERTFDAEPRASRNAATYCCSSASSSAVPGARSARTRSSSAQRARSSCSFITHHLSRLFGPVGRGTGTSGRGARRRAPPRVSCRPAPRPPPRRGRRPRGA